MTKPVGSTPPAAGGAPIDPPAYTVPEFCAAHRIGRSLYYELARAGAGPRVTKFGSRAVIFGEDAREWRARRRGEARP
jgi:predicted DNA-binding transcriptional regulator AlpA